MNQKRQRSSARTTVLLGAAVAVLAAVLFGATLARGPCVGEPAQLLAAHADLTPFPPLSHPLWHLCVQGLARLPCGTLALRANVLNVVFAVVAVLLLFAIMRRVGPQTESGPFLAHGQDNLIDEQLDYAKVDKQSSPKSFGADLYDTAERPPPDSVAERLRSAARGAAPSGAQRTAVARRVAAVVAVLFLCGSAPFWTVATRGHPAGLDTFLLLAEVWLLARYLHSGRLPWLYVAAACYAWFAAELPTLILFAPVFGIVALYGMFRHFQLGRRPIARCVVLALPGLGAYALVAWRFWLSPSAEWREVTSYGWALWAVLQEQYRIIRWSTPQIGWMLIGILTVFPLLMALLAWRASDPDVRLWAAVASVPALGVGFAFLFDARFTPWSMFGFWPLLVTPYVLAAAWTGYFVGWWYHTIRYGLFRDGEPGGIWFLAFLGGLLRPVEETGDPRRRRVVGAAWVGLAGAAVVAGGVLNFPRVDARPAAAVARFADRMVAAAGSREWLVGGGALQGAVTLAAHEHRLPLRYLDLRLAGTPPYRRWLAAQFEDPRLRETARIGVEPLLMEWARVDPRFANEVAAVDVPDLWTLSGLQPLPRSPLYLGAPQGTDAAAPEALIAAARATSGLLVPARPALAAAPQPTRSAGEWCLRHASRLANDLGVWLEEHGRPDDALASYAQARALYPDNICALLNETDLAKRNAPERWPALADQVNDYIRGLHRRLNALRTMQVYGLLRNPAAQLERAQFWAGRGQLAAAEQAIEQAGESGVPPAVAEGLLASLLTDARQPERGEAVWREMLQRDPGNAEARLGLARTLLARGDADEATRQLDALPDDPNVKARAALLRILADGGRGRWKEAREKVDALVMARPRDPARRALQAWVVAAQGDDKALASALDELKPLARASPPLALFLARLELDRGEPRAARAYCEDALRGDPGRVAAWELLVEIDYAEGRRDLAEQHVSRLLRLDPQNVLANQFLASFQIAREQYLQAEMTLRRALAAARTPGVLNDLAWVLFKQGRAREALPLAEEAVQLDPKSWPAGDTLGVIQMELGRFDEARASLTEAVRLSGGAPEAVLHLSELGRRAELQSR